MLDVERLYFPCAGAANQVSFFSTNENALAGPTSKQFFLVAAVIIAATAWLAFVSDQPLLLSGLLYLNLVALALYDLRYFRLPNLLTLTLLVGGAVSVWLYPRFGQTHHFIGAVVGLLLFPTLNYFYRRLRRRDGIGFGDAKLLAGLGFWLGWQSLPPLLLIASVLGLVFALGIGLAAKKTSVTDKMNQPLPFGSFLCLGGWLTWLFL